MCKRLPNIEQNGMRPSNHSRVPAVRRQVARILLISALVLSLVFGAVALLFEGWRAAIRFEAMAVAAASALTAKLVDQCEARIEMLDDRMVAEFLAERHQVPGGHFVSVRISDHADRLMAQATAHDFSGLSEYHHPDFLQDHQPPYWDILLRNGELFVLVVREMVGTGEQHPWRFQGMFHIESETRDHVIGVALEAMVLTALAVLLTTGVLYPIITRLNRDLLIRSEELMHSHIAILQALGSAIAKRDSDTHMHNFRVTFYAVRLAEAANRPQQEIASLIKGAFLHDLGKIAISDTILLKPGRLTDEEMVIMRTHVAHGLEMVAGIPWLADAQDVVGGHHERWNGTGYPIGLAGDDIPVNARIFAIADVFDALTSRRPYKDPLPLEIVLNQLRAERGVHFDPLLTDIFLSLAPGLFETTRQDEAMAKTVFRMADAYLEM